MVTIAGFYKIEDGVSTTLGTGCYYTTGEPTAVKIKVDGSSLKVWINGSLCKSITDSTHAEGGVALQGEDSRYDNLEIGYDNNDDDDIDDANDDIMVDEDFDSTSVTVSHDHAGNLIDDGTFRYVYDAPALDSRLRQREPIAVTGSCQ